MNQIILTLTLISSLMSLYLQFQNRKMKKLEEEKKSIVKKLTTALKSIQGYHGFVNEVSKEKGKKVEFLKAEIHSKFKESFIDTKFVEPKNIQELIYKYQ